MLPLLLNNGGFFHKSSVVLPFSQHLHPLCIPGTVDPAHGLQGPAGIFVIHHLSCFPRFLQALGDLRRSLSLSFPFPAREPGLMDLDPSP